MNRTRLMWATIALFGAVAAADSALAVGAAPGVLVPEAVAAVAGLLVLGASIFALRDHESFEPTPRWTTYLVVGCAVGYVALTLV